MKTNKKNLAIDLRKPHQMCSNCGRWILDKEERFCRNVYEKFCWCPKGCLFIG